MKTRRGELHACLHYKPFPRPNKPPRVTLLRDYCAGAPLPLRRTPHVVQIAITRTPGGGFVVEVGGAPSFVLKASELRFWPTVQHHLEKAIGYPVERTSRRAWAWDLAKRGLAPWTAEARQYDAANETWFDNAFEAALCVDGCRWPRHGAAAGGNEACVIFRSPAPGADAQRAV